MVMRESNGRKLSEYDYSENDIAFDFTVGEMALT